MAHQLSRRDFLKLGGTGILSAAMTAGGIKPGGFKFTPSPLQPNVLLIVMDTVRADRMSLLGYHKPTTPNIQQFAMSGMLFNNAIAPSSWTLPSHAAMFTGRRPFELSADWDVPLDATYPTLAEAFREAGYLTSGFIANNNYCSYGFGLNRGFEHYEDYLVNFEQIMMSGSIVRAFTLSKKIKRKYSRYDNFGRKSAELITNSFLKWLEKQDSGAPFFTFINYFDSHYPYLPPKEFVPEYAPGRPAGFTDSEVFEKISPKNLREISDAYDGTIAYIDQQIGVILAELAKNNQLKNTLVIITSDHGEQFGDHDMLGHGNTLYRALIHVPLVMVLPGRIASNQVIDKAVSMNHLAATILELADLKTSDNFPGTSLLQAGNGASDGELIYSEFHHIGDYRGEALIGKWQSMIQDQWHYVHQPDRVEELFDYLNDPLEAINLADKKVGQEMLSKFRSYLSV